MKPKNLLEMYLTIRQKYKSEGYNALWRALQQIFGIFQETIEFGHKGNAIFRAMNRVVEMQTKIRGGTHNRLPLFGKHPLFDSPNNECRNSGHRTDAEINAGIA